MDDWAASRCSPAPNLVGGEDDDQDPAAVKLSASVKPSDVARQGEWFCNRNPDEGSNNCSAVDQTDMVRPSKVPRVKEVITDGPRCLQASKAGHVAQSRLIQYEVDNAENVLQCVACRNAYHPDCLDGQGSQLKGGMWICRQCKPCEVCGLATRPEDMIACESCDDRRHKSCLIPIEDLRTDLTEGAPPEGLQYEGLQYEGLQYEDKVSLSHCPLSLYTHNHTLTYTHYHL